MPTQSDAQTRVNPKQITTKQELADTFAYFLSRGAAAERFVSAELFSELLQSANKLTTTQDKVGGNAALMAQVFNQVRQVCPKYMA